jgi:hypothetical protein
MNWHYKQILCIFFFIILLLPCFIWHMACFIKTLKYWFPSSFTWSENDINRPCGSWKDLFYYFLFLKCLFFFNPPLAFKSRTLVGQLHPNMVSCDFFSKAVAEASVITKKPLKYLSSPRCEIALGKQHLSPTVLIRAITFYTVYIILYTDDTPQNPCSRVTPVIPAMKEA